MAKITVYTKSERKERDVELAWRQREAAFNPKISKEKAWERFEQLREKSLGY